MTQASPDAQASASIDGRSLDERAKGRAFAILFAVLLSSAAGNTALQTVLPAIGREVGIPDVLISSIFSLSALLWGVMSPVFHLGPLKILPKPPPVALITVIEFEIRNEAMPAPRIHISSCGAASMITSILPPDMMKLPNTRPNSRTMPMIWNMTKRAPRNLRPDYRR